MSLLIVLIGMALFAQAEAAGLMVVDEAVVVKKGTNIEIRVQFNELIQSMGYSRGSVGSRFYIDLRRNRLTNPIELPEQVVNVSSDSDALVKMITYSEDGDGFGRLDISLSRVYEMSLEMSPDLRELVITLVQPSNQMSATPAQEELAKELMSKARRELIDTRDFKAALSLYQRVLGLPPNTKSQDALEYLGLVHERMGEREEAIRVYDHYLNNYPEGDGADRVSQRRISLITATEVQKQRRRESTPVAESSNLQVYGSVSQYYYRNNYTVNDETQLTASLLATNADILARYRTDHSESLTRFSGGYAHNLLEQDKDRSTYVSAAYADYHDEDIGLEGRVGRQNSSRDGVLGRFDGIRVAYDITKKSQVAFVAGYPVNTSYEGLDTDRKFTGISMNFGPYWDAWEFSLYGLNQTANDLTDRQAVGGEVRYFDPSLSVVSLLDYDVFFDEINIGLLLVTWNLTDSTTMNATADVRKLPILTTQNSLQGQITLDFQAILSTSDLQNFYSDKEIYQLAKDRSAESHSLSLGISHAFNSRYRMSSDVNVFNISSTTESGGVLAQPASGNQYFVNTQIIGTGIISEADITHVGARWSQSQSASSQGVYAGSRFLLNKQWRLSTRLAVDQVQWTFIEKKQLRYSPKVRVEYHKSRFQSDLEFGSQFSNSELADDSEQSWSLFTVLGVRLEF
ncbi:MAG: tetratricopeptide repeat protein [Oleibacter sp.]|nr:tetratricopeptide repeat protein [Thalassolituus sp.]